MQGMNSALQCSLGGWLLLSFRRCSTYPTASKATASRYCTVHVCQERPGLGLEEVELQFCRQVGMDTNLERLLAPLQERRPLRPDLIHPSIALQSYIHSSYTVRQTRWCLLIGATHPGWADLAPFPLLLPCRSLQRTTYIVVNPVRKASFRWRTNLTAN